MLLLAALWVQPLTFLLFARAQRSGKERLTRRTRWARALSSPRWPQPEMGSSPGETWSGPVGPVLLEGKLDTVNRLP